MLANVPAAWSIGVCIYHTWMHLNVVIPEGNSHPLINDRFGCAFSIKHTYFVAGLPLLLQDSDPWVINHPIAGLLAPALLNSLGKKHELLTIPGSKCNSAIQE